MEGRKITDNHRGLVRIKGLLMQLKEKMPLTGVSGIENLFK